MVFDLQVCACSLTSFILFTLLSSIGWMFQYRRVVALGQKMSDSKSKPRVVIKLNAGEFCGQNLSAGTLLITPAMHPSCGWTHRGAQWEQLLYTRIRRWYIWISRKFPNTISELLPESVGMVQQWCDRTQLSVSPQKMLTVLFTRKRDLRGLKEPTLSGHKLQLSTEVRYLRLILDKELMKA